MKISTRLAAGFGLIILLCIICTGTAIQALHHASDSMKEVVNLKMKKSSLASTMLSELKDMAISVRTLGLLSDPEGMKPANDLMQKSKTDFLANMQALQQLMKRDATPAGLADLKRLTEAQDTFFKVFEQARQLGLTNQDKLFNDFLVKNVNPVQDWMVSALTDLTRVQKKNSVMAVEKNTAITTHATLNLMLLAGASLLAGLVTCVLAIRVLMRQLGGEPAQAQALAAAIASGDLTTSVTLRRNDTTSLLASLDSMQANLRGLVSQIKDTSASVALAADEIAQGNTELSSRTEEQAAALQETAASMEQLTATVKSNTAGAQQTAESARDTAQLAREGGSDVQRMSVSPSSSIVVMRSAA